jgi:two-component system LytT family response regulator
MAYKLKVVILDDDPHIVNILQTLCKHSEYAEVVKTFNSPAEFIKEAPSLDFDMALLDVQMPEIEGTLVAQMLKNKAFMFITGAKEKLYEVLGLSPIDVVTKPIMKDRLELALAKAHKLLIDKKEYALFNMAEAKSKVKVFLPDIMLITTDEVDPRHKVTYLRNGEKYTIMDKTLESLVDMCPNLLQVNRSAAVSIEVVNGVEHDMVTLKKITGVEMPKYVNLGAAFSKAFKEKLFYK